MDERVTDLEIRYTHLERLVSELSQVIYDQGLKLEAQERKLKELEARPTEASQQSFDIRETPPHY